MSCVFVVEEKYQQSVQGSLKQGGAMLIIFILKGVRPVVDELVQFSQLRCAPFLLRPNNRTQLSSIQLFRERITLSSG